MTKPEHNAFATPLPKDVGYTDENNYDGLSKREYFAAMAMQGVCASNMAYTSGDIAEWSVKMADALIEALNKTTNHENQ